MVSANCPGGGTVSAPTRQTSQQLRIIPISAQISNGLIPTGGCSFIFIVEFRRFERRCGFLKIKEIPKASPKKTSHESKWRIESKQVPCAGREDAVVCPAPGLAVVNSVLEQPFDGFQEVFLAQGALDDVGIGTGLDAFGPFLGAIERGDKNHRQVFGSTIVAYGAQSRPFLAC